MSLGGLTLYDSWIIQRGNAFAMVQKLVSCSEELWTTSNEKVNGWRYAREDSRREESVCSTAQCVGEWDEFDRVLRF
jgi:hypothetical protein